MGSGVYGLTHLVIQHFTGTIFCTQMVATKLERFRIVIKVSKVYSDITYNK